MKRDFDLIRTILFRVEELDAFQTHKPEPLDGYPEAVVLEHIELLIEAGLIEANVIRFADNRNGHYSVRRLTWDGHDFLDSIRADTVWAKVRSQLLKPMGGVAFGLLKEWLKAQAHKHLDTLSG